jgi:hypothetical protein
LQPPLPTAEESYNFFMQVWESDEEDERKEEMPAVGAATPVEGQSPDAGTQEGGAGPSAETPADGTEVRAVHQTPKPNFLRKESG